ncbi:tRNA pseudouridine(38/39) synthase [Hypomesus transpacificus]|uniref:tRNA pseudouridine(38/39) synthase n=1 Tax=Hypomesus transpacificus TaxID=137520 RepID=UPI001F07EB86|nr:tRNA pseudouridine(38/39) synthase [Hypomesus transpacificus]
MQFWFAPTRHVKAKIRFPEVSVVNALTSLAMSEDLLQRVRDLEAEVQRLKAQLGEKDMPANEMEGTTTSSLIEKVNHPDTTGGTKKGKKKGQERPFDFSTHPRRHVALRLAYLGWSYQGFAVQENTDNTVEARLFEAFLKTKLIQDRQSSNYHRCGRTDKGVSAFSQVISIDLRSNQFCGGFGVTLPANVGAGAKIKEDAVEVLYVKMLNRVLPQDIRILDWAPVAAEFSARFDCRSRTYRYYFPCGALNVSLMSEAAKRYEGTHDFRNICKMDVGNGVLQFQRTILSATIQPVCPHSVSSTGSHDLYVFEVKGLAFLYHQVRCMMAILLLIGQKLETPDIIDQLMDVDNNPRKPQYSMAVDFPLVLYDCHFEGLSWLHEAEEVSHTLGTLQHHWTQSAVKTQVLYGMVQGLGHAGGVPSTHCWLMEGTRQKNYKPLLERPCCESLESRIEHFVKRGRLEREEGENGGELVHRGKRSKLSHNSPHMSVVKEVSSNGDTNDKQD